MPRHSQNQTDRQFFTIDELRRAGWGTGMGANQFKERLKQDSFLWFGQCALSLKAPKDPVSTPHGYIYDREFILEYLLKEKKKLAEDKDKFDAQEAKKERSSVTRYLHRRRSSKAHQLGFLLFLSPLSSIFVYATTTRERRALTPAATNSLAYARFETNY